MRAGYICTPYSELNTKHKEEVIMLA